MVVFRRWLKPWASLCLGLYGVGIPALFLSVLIVNRKEIKVDQALRKQGLGYTRASNPHFVMRRRFQKLYSDFKPGSCPGRAVESVFLETAALITGAVGGFPCADQYCWRMVLLTRKFMLVSTTVMFNSLPLFQVRSKPEMFVASFPRLNCCCVHILIYPRPPPSPFACAVRGVRVRHVRVLHLAHVGFALPIPRERSPDIL